MTNYLLTFITAFLIGYMLRTYEVKSMFKQLVDNQKQFIVMHKRIYKLMEKNDEFDRRLLAMNLWMQKGGD